MLNEAYELQTALQAAKIPLPLVHPRIKTPVSGGPDRLRARLSSQGYIDRVEPITPDEWAGTWAMSRTSDPSFPVVRIKRPLLWFPYEHSIWPDWKKAKASGVRACLEVLHSALDQWDGACYRAETIREISTIREGKARELLSVYRRVAEYGCVRNIAHRFRRASRSPEYFLRNLADACLRSIEDGTLSQSDAVEALLLGSRPGRLDVKPKSVQVQIALDMAEECEPALYCRPTAEHVLTHLPTDAERRGHRAGRQNSGFCCAFSTQTDLVTGPFPPAVLPVVAPRGISIFSMKEETECNWRYGVSGSGIVPVSQSLALEMTAALHWSVTAGRKRKTWRPIASGQFVTQKDRKVEKDDLLIVYVDGKPDMESPVAGLFAADPDADEKQFHADASAVCEAFEGIADEMPESLLRLFILRQVSPGQVQVALSRSYSPREVITAAKEWQKAAGNVDRIRLPVLQKGEPPRLAEPTTPHPDQVVRALSRQWIRGGVEETSVQGVEMGDILTLMLGAPTERKAMARRVLALALRDAGPLLVGLMGAMRSGRKDRLDPFRQQHRKTALTAISVLGITLQILGRKKEDYMHETPYLIGKMLALADDIHKSYCEVVRDGSQPPALLGNSLLVTAAENPAQALSTLLDRLRVYVAWADTAAYPEANAQDSKSMAIRIAKKRVSQYGPITEQVHNGELPGHMDDEDKAHLLLGYLARTTEQ